MFAVLGAGSWGTALAVHLARLQHPVVMWSHDALQVKGIQESQENKDYFPGMRLPESLQVTNSLQQALKQAQYIVMAVPSHAFVEVIEAIKPFYQSQVIISATKGLESKKGRFLHEVAYEKLGHDCPYAVLSGPSFAKEVMEGLPTAITLAMPDQQILHKVMALMGSKYFRIYASNDLLGVQLGGIYKNIIAVAAGISDGLALGSNARAALITRGLAEMMRLGAALSANASTLTGLAGCGDLILTCTGDLSRNRRFGLALGQGMSLQEAKSSIGQVVEALDNANEMCALAKQLKEEVPIALQVRDILAGHQSPKQALDELLARAPRTENDC